MRLVTCAAAVLAVQPAFALDLSPAVTKVWVPPCAEATTPLFGACAQESAAAASRATAGDTGGGTCSGGCQSAIDFVYQECAGTTGQLQEDEWDTEVAIPLDEAVQGWGCRAGTAAVAAPGVLATLAALAAYFI